MRPAGSWRQSRAHAELGRYSPMACAWRYVTRRAFPRPSCVPSWVAAHAGAELEPSWSRAGELERPSWAGELEPGWAGEGAGLARFPPVGAPGWTAGRNLPANPKRKSLTAGFAFSPVAS